MNEQSHLNEKSKLVSEPITDVYKDIARLKTTITSKIQETQDKTLLKEIYLLLESEKPVNNPLNLSRHIEEVFEQYPQTLSKLAQ